MAKQLEYLRKYRRMRRANLNMPLTAPMSPHAIFGPGHSEKTFRQSIWPVGRAPHGQGPEYAARRKVANRLDYVDSRIGYIRGKLQTTRGQAKFRRRDTRFRARLRLLRRFRQTALKIAQSSSSWGFKQELINDLYISSVRSALPA